MKNNLRIWAAVLAIALLTGLLIGCGADGSSSMDEQVELVTVERGSLASSISAVGSVRARTEALLSFDTAGRVSQVLVQAGDQVRQDQPLAQLDSADLELQLRSAEAALASAQAQLAQLESGPRSEEITAAQGQVGAAQAAVDQAIAQRDQLLAGATEKEIAAARAAITSAKAAYDRVKAGPTAEELAQLRAAVDSAAAALEQAQTAYDRVKARPEAGLLPEALALQNATIEMERAQASLDALLSHPTDAELAAAAAQVAQAEAQLAQLEASARPQLHIAEAAVRAAQAQQDIAQAQLDLLRAGASDAEIAAAQAQVAQAQVAVDTARLALQRATLVAPSDGTLARVDVEPGESVSPQMPAMTLVGDSQFTIEADVDEADIGSIRVGQEVQITFDAFPGRQLVGQVASIAPLADVDLGIVSYRVTIEGEPTELPLRAGMTANAEIVREQREDILLVPNLAISLDPETGQRFVDRQTASGTERVEIVTGLMTDLFSEVASGLSEGDLLVITNPSAREQFREMMGASFTGGESK
jgi:HlyD family secretion protein